MSNNRTDTVDIRALGHMGDGGNADDHFLGAQLLAKARVRADVNSRLVGSTTVNIPAGDYTVTQLNAILGRESMAGNITGIRFKGAGTGLTTIVFTPTEVGALVFNDYWHDIHFEGISFLTTYAGAVFMRSYTTHAAQAYTFRNIEWRGEWKYIFDLQGDNNNCEFSFYQCMTSGMQTGGTFLYIGASNTSDQFLNYWFYGFKHWSTSASIIDAAKGGHFHFYGLDCSAFAEFGLSAMAYLFNLRGNNHAKGVQSLTVEGMRVEGLTSYAGLLYSEWATGNVTIECDWNSQAFAVTYGDIVNIRLGNVAGPIYNFHDSTLAGGVRVEFGSNSFQQNRIIEFNHCVWEQKKSPSDVVTYETSTGNLAYPPVQFNSCRGTEYQDAMGTGLAIWDATVSSSGAVHGGNLAQPVQYRTVSVRVTTGSVPFTSYGAPKVILPMNALITDIEAMSPAGGSAEANGGDWVVATTDGSPVTIGTVTVAGAMSAGYRTNTALTVPFRCDTDARRTVTVTHTNVANLNRQGLVLIKGYW